MQDKFEKIKHTLKHLYQLQKRHLETFTGENLLDVENQSDERAREFDGLMNRVNDFIKAAKEEKTEDTESMLIFLNDSITALLEQNRAIETKVRGLKDSMEKDMKKLSRGKKAIGSYRSNTASSADPLVISITN